MKTLKSFLFAALFALAGVCPPPPALADGLIIIRPPWDQPGPHPMPSVLPGHFSFGPLAVNYHRVNVEINNLDLVIGGILYQIRDDEA